MKFKDVLKLKKLLTRFNIKQVFKKESLYSFKKFSIEFTKNLLEKLSNIGTLFRDTRIQTRLIVAFLGLSLIPLSFIGYLSYTKSKGAIKSKIETYSVQVIDQVRRNIELEMTSFSRNSSDISFDQSVQADLFNFSFTTDTWEKSKLSDQLRQSLEKKFLLTDAVTDAKLLTYKYETDGDEVDYSGSRSDAEDPWKSGDISRLIKNAGEKGGVPVWSLETYKNGHKNLVISSQISSLSSGIAQLGYIIVAIDEKHFSSVYSGIDIGKGADIFIMDSNGVVISSGDPEKIEVGKAYKTKALLNNLKSKEQHINDMASNDNTVENQIQKNRVLSLSNQLVAYSVIEDTDWYVVSTIPYSYLNAESNNIRNFIILCCIVFFIIALILSFIISRSISVPLNKLVGLMKEAKGGNLAIKIRDSRKDEIGEVVCNFNDMVANISSLVSQVSTSAQNVLSNSEEIASSAEQSYAASEMVASTIQQIAKGSSEQAEEVSKSVENMNKLADGINEVGSDMATVSDIVNNTRALSEDALGVVRSLNDKAIETSAVSKNIVEDISSLSNHMKEIKKIVKVIVGIAEQTNLLALNAAIEAARAGAAGKGFAVVADEVKKLADQSKEASVMINNIIGSIQQKTEVTVNSANIASAIIDQQMDAVEEADNAFKNIFNAMAGISSQINNMEVSVREILKSKENSLQSMENISAVSEEAAATAEEVSAGAQEQMIDSDKLFNFSKELNEMAQDLNKSITIFRI